MHKILNSGEMLPLSLLAEPVPFSVLCCSSSLSCKLKNIKIRKITEDKWLVLGQGYITEWIKMHLICSSKKPKPMVYTPLTFNLEFVLYLLSVWSSGQRQYLVCDIFPNSTTRLKWTCKVLVKLSSKDRKIQNSWDRYRFF